MGQGLGRKAHKHIKNIVQENSITWDDHYLDWVEMEDIFGLSAEKIGAFFVKRHAAQESAMISIHDPGSSKSKI
jgi:glucosamine--fructose-6-phosphate aminotransferase (isomerizing)